jgi:hypothetical protein
MVHLREQYPGPLPSEIAGQRNEAAEHSTSPEIHHPNARGQLVAEGTSSRCENQVDRQSALGDPLREVQGYPLGTTSRE